jgi:hypothetical protein
MPCPGADRKVKGDGGRDPAPPGFGRMQTARHLCYDTGMGKKARIILWIILCAAAAAWAANYRFEVPENISHVHIQADGLCRIEYFITFANQGDPIDVVDIGLPNRDYRLDTAKADLDGRPLSGIKKSTYVSIGVEVPLGSAQIERGNTGKLHFEILQGSLLYQDEKDPAYASCEFVPTWYGADFTSGKTRYKVYFHFPPGTTVEEPRWHGEEPTMREQTEQGIYYLWDFEGTPSTAYKAGVSFPSKYSTNVLTSPPPAESESGSGGAGSIIGSLISQSCPCIFFVGILALIVFGVVSAQKRKRKYLPATIGVEGVEVRRGLTVPEAGALMEMPVNKVLATILFGLVKKGRAKVVSTSPLLIEPLEGKPGDAPLLIYEEEFLKSVKEDKKLDPKEAEDVLVKLIGRVKDDMKGFNRKKTVAYYQAIMARAWEQMKGADWSEAFEYVMLDEKADQKLPEVFGGRTIVLPPWWGGYNPGYRHVPSSTGPSGAPSMGGLDFAHNLASGIENFANRLVGNITGLAQNVTQRTNPVPVSSGGGGHSSGGGCACACACAGCACACAGGGR